MIAREAEGFLYVVSSMGVTGVRSEIGTDLSSIVQNIRQVTKTPCAIGFGISTPRQARQIAEVSDGAIVGSAIVKNHCPVQKRGGTKDQGICTEHEGGGAGGSRQKFSIK